MIIGHEHAGPIFFKRVTDLLTPAILMSHAHLFCHSSLDAESSLYAFFWIARLSRAMTE
jgi:hypothetical protein